MGEVAGLQGCGPKRVERTAYLIWCEAHDLLEICFVSNKDLRSLQAEDNSQIKMGGGASL